MPSHDQNFKNLFQDFPEEALEWILPGTLQTYGPVRHIEFIRQEPPKHRLSDHHLSLDMPILFRFDRHQVILWIVEFQEDKAKFSIYRLLRYTTDMAESHPEALVIPTVLFTDRTRWRKTVPKMIDHQFGNRCFLHFEYIFLKLFDFKAKDHYNSKNPLVRILLPKMDYTRAERGEVFRHALIGLFQLTTALMFEKYTEFIDLYTGLPEEERETIYQELSEEQETAMITEYFKEKGIQEGIQQGEKRLLCRQIAKKYGLSSDEITSYLEHLKGETLLELSDRILEWDSFDQIKSWIQQQKKSPLEQ